MSDNWIEQSVYSAFITIAEKYPQHEALIDHQTVLTYVQLLHQVNQYAAVLERCIVNKETPVAIWLPNDCRFIICMLAINSLGRAYLPLDYSFPQRRNFEILRHSGITTVITNSFIPLQGNEPKGSTQYIDIAHLASGSGTENYISKATKDDLSYIIYTSGSTGQPKGVYQNQKNMLHDVMQYIQTARITAHDRCTLFYSPAVSGAIRDIYGSLLSGATLCIADLKTEGVSVIGRFLAQHRITVYHSLPGIFRAFLSLEKNVFDHIRLAYLAGDRILATDFELFKTYFNSSAQLYVGIGSTENATIYCQWLLDHTTTVNQLLLPLGYPVPDRKFKLVNENNKEVSLGQEGEIVVTSKYMALGYWNDKELSKQAFTDNNDGSRTFKTGDMGRLLDNGMLYYLGRADKQVKIDGHRIEVDEVSEKIRQISGVKEAAVIVHRAEENCRLIAFVVLENSLITTARLKVQLSQILPAYMVPASLIALPAMPLLDNFKVDYQELKHIYQEKLARAATAQAADIDSHLKKIWLKYTDHSSYFDNDQSFHEAGGSSIEVVYMVVELEKLFKIDIPAHFIHSSLKPSALIKLIINGVETKKARVKVTPYKIYLFSPFDGLSTNQISLVKKLSFDYETVIIQYPDTTLRASEDMLDKSADWVIAQHFSNPVANAVYLGICNGNHLAQVVAAKLPAIHQPVLYVNVDSAMPALGSKSLKQRLINLDHRMKAYGLNVVLGEAIVARINGLKKTNFKLYLKLVEQLKKWCQLSPSVTDLYINNETRGIPAPQIPVLLFTGTELTSIAGNNNYGWNNQYSKVSIKALPYLHSEMISNPDSQNLIIAHLKYYLAENHK